MQPHNNQSVQKPNYLAVVPRQPLTPSPDIDLPEEKRRGFDGNDDFFGDDDGQVYDGQIVDSVPPTAQPVSDVDDLVRLRRGTYNAPKELLCPTCKTPLCDDAHGWLVASGERNRLPGGKLELVPCPDCTGNVEQKQHARKQAALVHRLFGESDIPWSMRYWDFSSYPHYGDQAAKAQVQAFVSAHLRGDRKRRGLWLYGSYGHGKTSLAVSALKQVIRERHLGIFVLTSDFFDRMRASFRPGSEEHTDQLITAMQTVTWLVLDDVGVERPTPYVIEQLYRIVNLRMLRGLYTIFTSNFSPRDLLEYWCEDGKNAVAGQRIIERIREYCTGIAVNGQNLREKAK